MLCPTAVSSPILQAFFPLGRQGWENVTDAAIRSLSKKRSGIVFLLWGKFAQDKAKLIDNGKHHVLTAAHPSGL